jgi:hypothetical protein
LPTRRRRVFGARAALGVLSFENVGLASTGLCTLRNAFADALRGLITGRGGAGLPAGRPSRITAQRAGLTPSSSSRRLSPSPSARSSTATASTRHSARPASR